MMLWQQPRRHEQHLDWLMQRSSQLSRTGLLQLHSEPVCVSPGLLRIRTAGAAAALSVATELPVQQAGAAAALSVATELPVQQAGLDLLKLAELLIELGSSV
jgi:hypothetical protein